MLGYRFDITSYLMFLFLQVTLALEFSWQAIELVGYALEHQRSVRHRLHRSFVGTRCLDVCYIFFPPRRLGLWMDSMSRRNDRKT